MNILLIFFAIPLATIILAGILETLIHCPFKVAGIFFAIFIVATFALGGTAILIVAAIIYTLIAFVTAVIVRLLINRMCSRCDDQVSGCRFCRDECESCSSSNTLSAASSSLRALNDLGTINAINNLNNNLNNLNTLSNLNNLNNLNALNNLNNLSRNAFNNDSLPSNSFSGNTSNVFNNNTCRRNR